MSTTEVENKAQFRRIYEEMFNKGNLAIADELIAPDFLNHEAPPGSNRGPESMRRLITMLHTAFPESSISHRILIVIGLAIGAVLGLGGNFLPAGSPQNVTYALSSLGIIMGSALFAAWFARRDHSIVAVGFALLALAESISFPGLFLLASAPTFPGAYTFAAGVTLYAVALPLVSVPSAFPLWTRIAGTLAAIPFATHGLLWLLGRSPAPSGPFASIGYAVLAVAVVGWMITVLRTAPSSQR